MSRYPSIFGGDSQSLLGPGIDSSPSSNSSSSFAAAYVHLAPARSTLPPPQQGFTTSQRTGCTVSQLQNPPIRQERPVLSVAEPLVHPWIGFGGQLDFPSLRSWSPSSSLVKVVQDAYQGLGGQAQSPRPALPTNPPTSTPAPPQPSAASGAAQGPDFASLLDNVPTEQLAQAAQDADAFEALYQQLIAQHPDEGTAMLQRRQAALVEQAQANLQKEAALNDVRNQLAVIRSADCEGSVAQFNARRERVQAMMAPVAPGVLIANLQAAAQETDAESEQVVRQFITGQLPVDDFVGQYGDLRTLFHKRDLTKQAAMTSMPKQQR